MDVEAIEWLEEHLRQRQVTAIVVTHDRYFLESVTSDIWELEDAVLYAHKARATATDGVHRLMWHRWDRAFCFTPPSQPTRRALPTQGNYESFLEAKANRLAVAEATRASDLKKLKKELEWMRKQPRARQVRVCLR